MVLLPLVRPYIPPPEEWMPYFQKSRDAGVFSNFGPCEQLATKRLNEVTGKNCVLTSSGTAALQAIIAVYTESGAPLAIPAFTFKATQSAVLNAGRSDEVVPCGFDGLPRTDWLTENKDCYGDFVVTAPFGSYPEFERYDALAEKLGKRVFYDCAGGWGLPFERTQNPVAISFHATKTLAIGEGGAVLLDQDAWTLRVRDTINFGGVVGINGKLSEISAAILLAQLQPNNLRFAEMRTTHRRAMAKLYMKLCPKFDSSFSDGAPSLCAMGYTGDTLRLVALLNEAGIAAKRGYWPLIEGYGATDPGLSNIVCLPSDVTADEVRYIAAKVNEFGGV